MDFSSDFFRIGLKPGTGNEERGNGVITKKWANDVSKTRQADW